MKKAKHNQKLDIRKDDRVMVACGKDRGKMGKVLRVIPEKNRAVVEKVSMVKRHTRGGMSQTGTGGIVEKEAPVDVSNLMLVCNKCAEPTRVGHVVLENGQRARSCKRCGELLDS